ncbi:hypothetical protein MMPV_002793 [Pyropia vietnamensis]
MTKLLHLAFVAVALASTCASAVLVTSHDGRLLDDEPAGPALNTVARRASGDGTGGVDSAVALAALARSAKDLPSHAYLLRLDCAGPGKDSVLKTVSDTPYVRDLAASRTYKRPDAKETDAMNVVRYAPTGDLIYDFDLPSGGTYNLTAYFEEVSPPLRGVGRRIFSVATEPAGVPVPGDVDDWSSVDIYATVGAERVLAMTTTVEVSDTDRRLSLLLGRVVENPEVSLIEIRKTGTTAPPPTPEPRRATATKSTGELRLDCGGAGNAHNGLITDAAFVRDLGASRTYKHPVVVVDPATSLRYAATGNLVYTFSLPAAGTYNITFWAVELAFSTVGRRVFSVATLPAAHSMGGDLSDWSSVDVFATVGRGRALRLTALVTVGEQRKLSLLLGRIVNNPMASFIQIQSTEAGASSGATPRYSLNVDCGGGGDAVHGVIRDTAFVRDLSATRVYPALPAAYDALGTLRFSLRGDLAYDFAVRRSGTYRVTLYFAELYFSAVGKRIFSVATLPAGKNMAVMGTTGVVDWSAVDVFAAVGKDAILSLSSTVTVAEGERLSVVIGRVVNSPMLSRLDVRPVSVEMGGDTSVALAPARTAPAMASAAPRAAAAPQPTATPEATPAPTPEATPAPTPEATPAPTPEATPAPTPEATPAPTPEPTPMPTPEPTPMPTLEATPAPTPEATPAPTPEATPAPTPEATPAPTPEPTPMPTPEPTPMPTLEATPAPTPEATPAPTPEATPAPTPEPTPMPTPEPTPMPTLEATPAPTPEATPAPTPEATPAPTPEATPAPTPEPTPMPTPEPTPALTPEATPAPTPEPSPEPMQAESDPPPAPTQMPTEQPTQTLAPVPESAATSPPAPVMQARSGSRSRSWNPTPAPGPTMTPVPTVTSAPTVAPALTATPVPASILVKTPGPVPVAAGDPVMLSIDCGGPTDTGYSWPSISVTPEGPQASDAPRVIRRSGTPLAPSRQEGAAVVTQGSLPPPPPSVSAGVAADPMLTQRQSAAAAFPLVYTVPVPHAAFFDVQLLFREVYGGGPGRRLNVSVGSDVQPLSVLASDLDVYAVVNTEALTLSSSRLYATRWVTVVVVAAATDVTAPPFINEIRIASTTGGHLSAVPSAQWATPVWTALAPAVSAPFPIVRTVFSCGQNDTAYLQAGGAASDTYVADQAMVGADYGELWATARMGAYMTFSLPVPFPGRHAVVVGLQELVHTTPGMRVFSVSLVVDGTQEVVLAKDVDLVGDLGARWSQLELDALVTASTSIMLRLVASRDLATVSWVSVSSFTQ